MTSRTEDKHKAVLVAVAKNESLYLTEWVSYHLMIGFNKIIIFNNESDDKTLELLQEISLVDPRVMVIDWPTLAEEGPQEAAYNYAIKLFKSEWVAFFDIDEFLVPWRDKSVTSFLDKIPEDVSEIHINWRGFGSSFKNSIIYDFVVENFTKCSEPQWPSNFHYKTFVRQEAIEKVFTHFATISYGRRVLSDYTEVDSENIGFASKAIYDGIQINHYQCKTFFEFRQRMRNGNAYFAYGVAANYRESSYRRFLELDKNDTKDNKIDSFIQGMKVAFSFLERKISYHLQVRRLKIDRMSAVLSSQGVMESGLLGAGFRFFIKSSHGTVLAFNQDTREISHKDFSKKIDRFENISILFNDPSNQIDGVRLQDCLEQAVKLPDGKYLSEVFLRNGKIFNSIAFEIDGCFLSAQHDGKITADVKSCREWECFWLVSEEQLYLT